MGADAGTGDAVLDGTTDPISTHDRAHRKSPVGNKRGNNYYNLLRRRGTQPACYFVSLIVFHSYQPWPYPTYRPPDLTRPDMT